MRKILLIAIVSLSAACGDGEKKCVGTPMDTATGTGLSAGYGGVIAATTVRVSTGGVTGSGGSIVSPGHDAAFADAAVASDGQPDAVARTEGVDVSSRDAASDTVLTTPDAPGPRIGGGTCGDGVIQKSEECDDGNMYGNDGCTRICQIEEWYICPETGKPCVLTCTCPPLNPTCCVSAAQCGDDIVSTDVGESCDLGEKNGMMLDHLFNIVSADDPEAMVYCDKYCTIPQGVIR